MNNNTFNIRIINVNRNEYTGVITLEDNNTFYGIGREKNYENEINMFGNISEKGIYIHIFSPNDNIPVMALPSDMFPRKSLAPSKYFYGSSLDHHNDAIFIELTNHKDLIEKLTNSKQKVLSMSLRNSNKKNK